MNELTVFQNDQFGQVRTTLIDEEPWFVAADVCAALGHTNVTVALQMLDEDTWAKKSLGQVSRNEVSQNREMNIVSEAGLYELIFRSNLPAAKKFRRWVTHEVLPSIRKQGYYMTPAKAAEYLGEKAILMLANTIKEDHYRNSRIAAIAQSWEEQGLIRAGEKYHWEDYRSAYLNLQETAKLLGIKYRLLESFLITENILYRDRSKVLLPCPGFDPTMFILREHFDRDGKPFKCETYITNKGREYLRSLLNETD